MNQEQIHKFEVGWSVFVAIGIFGATLNDSWFPLIGGFLGFILGMYMGSGEKNKVL
mgnify:CR=1 FL=1